MKTSGFTLIELIIIMMIVSVLAIAAIPRLLGTQTFDARSFHDQTVAALRYAQKAAIAQRRTVCVTAGTGSITLTIASAAGSSTCDTSLAGPTGSSPFAINAPSGVSYSAAASFSFSSLGQPSGSTKIFQVNGVADSITVEQETGYVH
jgi:MSHA pilin protein MshC